ncbi:MAG: hypothetical protein ACN4GZ_08530, partial [Acidimicrobiales bacterium]
PSLRNPYLGIVVRAIEWDRTSAADRTLDYAAFIDHVKMVADEAAEFGGAPGPTSLYLAGMRPQLTDSLIDPDDRMGVSARAKLEWATPMADGLAREGDLDVGTPLGLMATETVRFQDDGVWELTFDWKLRAGRPGPDDFPSSTQFGIPPEPFIGG